MIIGYVSDGAIFPKHFLKGKEEKDPTKPLGVEEELGRGENPRYRLLFGRGKRKKGKVFDVNSKLRHTQLGVPSQR